MLTETILEALETKCHWDPTKPLVVGVSGGADSVALLHALNRAGVRLVVGHFNHHLRAAATRDADFVETLCQKWQLPFEHGEAEVQSLAKTWGIGIEEAARRLWLPRIMPMTKSKRS
jgi:tRNA(Ile)-lysidine synthase